MNVVLHKSSFRKLFIILLFVVGSYGLVVGQPCIGTTIVATRLSSGSCPPDTFSITVIGLIPMPGYRYEWDFGNGATPSSAIGLGLPMQVVYDTFAYGNQPVTIVLKILNAAGILQCTITQTIAIHSRPLGELYTPSIFQDCQDNFIQQFTDVYKPGFVIDSYFIDFPDSLAADYASRNPPYQYVVDFRNSGSYPITYTVWDNFGCSSSFSYTMNIGRIIPVPALKQIPQPGNSCDTMEFCIEISDYLVFPPEAIIKIDWNYNSGQAESFTKSGLSPSDIDTVCHVYRDPNCNPGYDVRVWVDLFGCQSTPPTVYPGLKVFSSPKALFAVNPVDPNKCKERCFDNLSIAGLAGSGLNQCCNTCDQFIWDFGDGTSTILTTTPIDVCHLYANSGLYKVTLRASNNTCGISTYSDSICIEDPPVASFDLDTFEGCAPLTVHDTNTTAYSFVCDTIRKWTVTKISGGALSGVQMDTAQNPKNPTIIFNQPGTYRLCLDESNSCAAPKFCETIYVYDKPTVSLQVPDTVCSPFTYIPHITINDNGRPVIDTIWSFPWANTIYGLTNPDSVYYDGFGWFKISVTVTNVCGSTTVIDSVYIKQPAPAPQITGDTILCNTDDLILSLTINTSYLPDTIGTDSVFFWIYPGGSLWRPDPSFSLSPPVVQSGTYYVYYFFKGCRSFMDSVLVIVDPPLVITITPSDTTICFGDTVLLVASGADTYNWTPAPDSFSSPNHDSVWVWTPMVDVAYLVKGTNSLSGCFGFGNAAVHVNPLPTVNVGNDITVCLTDSCIILSDIVPSSPNCEWTDSNTTVITDFCIDLFNVGNHILTYTCIDNHGCTSSDELVITVTNPTPIDAGPDLVICQGETIMLSPTPIPGVWSPSQIVGNTINVNGVVYTYTATNPGTDNLTYTIFPGSTCEDEDDVTITVYPKPVASIDHTSITICIGESITLTANGGTSYSWSTAEATQSISVAPIITTTYTVTVEDANGCTASANSIVTVNLLPNAVILPAVVSICIGESTTLIAIGGPSYLWSTTEMTNSITATPPSTTIYTVTVSGTNGCTASASRTVTVNPLPIASISLLNDTICEDDSTILTASGGTSYIWSTGATIISITVFPSSTTSYSVTVTDGNGCTASALETVNVNPQPSLTLTANPSDFCRGLGSSITALYDITFGLSWSDPLLTIPPFIVNPSSITTYSATVTNPITLCKKTDSVTITVNDVPIAGMSFDSIGCVGKSIQFTDASVSNGGLTYHWSFGDGDFSNLDSPTHTYAASGSYTVTHNVMYATGCSDDTAANIIIKDTAIANFTIAPDSGCGPLNVNITNFSEGDDLQFIWIRKQLLNGLTDTFSNSGSIILDGIQGIDVEYEIKLVVSNICNTDSLMDTVKVLSKPVADFGTDKPGGCDEPLTVNFLYASSPNSSWFQWYENNMPFNPGANFFARDFRYDTINSPDSTFYEIMLVDSNQCGQDTFTDTIFVLPPTVHALFQLQYTPGCQPLEVTIINQAAGEREIDYDYIIGTWANAPDTITQIFTSPGTYDICQFAKGCGFDTACQQVTVWPAPVIDFTVDSPHCKNQAVCFTNTSPGDSLVSAYTWDMGIPPLDSTHDACHTYPNAGTYQVILTGTHSQYSACWGHDTLSLTIHPLPEVGYTPGDIDGCTDLYAQFTNLYPNQPLVTTLWKFGDFDSSSLDNPLQKFTTIDTVSTYLVRLTLTNQLTGCSNDTTSTVIVYPKPISNFSILNTDTCGVPIDLCFDNQSLTAIDFLWNFGTGWENNNEDTVCKTYSDSGKYDIALIALNSYGCRDTFSRDFQAIELPTLNFSFNPLEGCEPLQVCFDLEPNNATGYAWSFGETTENPCSVFFAGIYDSISVTLSYFDICFNTIYSQSSLIVHEKPFAEFHYLVRDSAYDGTFQFNNTSTDATSYYWDYDYPQGQPVITEDTATIYRYYENRKFIVMLIASNDFCRDTVFEILLPDFLGGLFVPNAFTPESGPLEVRTFKPVGVGLGEYEIEIYSPAGTLLWESNKLENGMPAEGWDGYYKGRFMQQDAYVWKVHAIFEDGRVWGGMRAGNGKYYKAGTVTLIR